MKSATGRCTKVSKKKAQQPQRILKAFKVGKKKIKGGQKVPRCTGTKNHKRGKNETK